MEEEVKKEGIQEEKKEEKPLNRMTAIELREIAKEIPGVEGVHAMKKEQLLDIIKEARGIKDEVPKKKRAGRGGAPALSAAQLKEKIVQLKKEKGEALSAKARKKMTILRRRINRLKKRTRKVAQA